MFGSKKTTAVDSVPATHSDASVTPPSEKNETHFEGIENIRTISRVPGNDHYYEKDGLRTYGDDEDHDHEPPVCFSTVQNILLYGC